MKKEKKVKKMPTIFEKKTFLVSFKRRSLTVNRVNIHCSTCTKREMVNKFKKSIRRIDLLRTRRCNAPQVSVSYLSSELMNLLSCQKIHQSFVGLSD